MNAKILVVDDEPNMRLGLKDNLELEGYHVDLADNGIAGLESAMAKTYDLILLDVMMPGMSGLEVCKRLRAGSVKSFILLLTAKSEEIDKVVGLEIGADDYVTKPFSVRELLARIKAILRRGAATQTSSGSVIGKLTVNFETYTASNREGPVHMSHKEFAILNYLSERQGEVVSRDNLLKAVWGYNDTPTTRTVDNFIVKLRNKVEEDPNDPKLIITVHGIGYTLAKTGK